MLQKWQWATSHEEDELVTDNNFDSFHYIDSEPMLQAKK